jgi:hypothetical protein
MNQTIPDYEFIAFIDEAGDPSLKRVRPIDEKGGTEWMVISAVLVSRANEKNLDAWLHETAARISDPGTNILKFSKRSPEERLIICRHLAELPIRIFVVASNKRNMRGHRNARAEKIPSKQWFYNWLTRLLVERITDYCHRRADRHGLSRRHVKFVFSKAGGHSYSQTRAYLQYLKMQTAGRTAFLKRRSVSVDVMDWALVEEFPHFKKAGLQYADIPASAFYQAIDNLDTGPCNVRYAEALAPRIAMDENDIIKDYGVTIQPFKEWEIPIGEDQREIFRFYGYTFIPTW